MVVVNESLAYLGSFSRHLIFWEIYMPFKNFGMGVCFCVNRFILKIFSRVCWDFFK